MPILQQTVTFELLMPNIKVANSQLSCLQLSKNAKIVPYPLDDYTVPHLPLAHKFWELKSWLDIKQYPEVLMKSTVERFRFSYTIRFLSVFLSTLDYSWVEENKLSLPPLSFFLFNTSWTFSSVSLTIWPAQTTQPYHMLPPAAVFILSLATCSCTLH